MKCRILYDYPSGNLHAVQVFVSDKESYVFSSDGKYIDYTPYVKEVKEKVVKKLESSSKKTNRYSCKRTKRFVSSNGIDS